MSKKLSAGAGVDWIREGWPLFKKAPLMWILLVVVAFVLSIMVSVVPFIGQWVPTLFSGVLVAGFVTGCRALEGGGELELEHLFAGFRSRFAPLLMIGVLYLAGEIAILLVFGMFVGFSIVTGTLMGSQAGWIALLTNVTLPILAGFVVALALLVPLAAAAWFAPALVLLKDLSALDAMARSFFACFGNFSAFVIYGLVMPGLMIVAMIPLGLGLLVWVPLAITSYWRSYRAIFD